MSASNTITKWAECRCRCTRAPTDPCRCVWDGRKWTCDRPVKTDCDQVTAKDRSINRTINPEENVHAV